jgi:hypothetical protein
MKKYNENKAHEFLTLADEIRLNCKNSADFESGNLKIVAFNKEIFNDAVAEIAKAKNPLALLLDCPCVPQIAKIADNGENAQFTEKCKDIAYTDIVGYIAKWNKNHKDSENLQIAPIFNAEELQIFQWYGANLTDEFINSVSLANLKRYCKISKDFEVFTKNSNTGRKEQLQWIFDCITAKINGEKVNAIEVHSKLIAKNFTTYKDIKNGEIKHEISNKGIHFLVKCIIAQYIISKEKAMLTASSKLAMHKAPKEKTK